MTAPPTLITHRNDQRETAVILVHGFAGNPSKTWGRFPELLAARAALGDWDIFSLGYTTRLAPDIVGIWSADAPLVSLAELFITACRLPPLDRYRSLAVVAHSMGGLIVQRAVVDDAELCARVGHVVLFGTPSAGLAKASPFAFWKRQFRDMGEDSEFITDLRRRWAASLGSRSSFAFWVVAGDQDEFVPRVSSIEPFDPALRAVVPGNHLSIVKPVTELDMGLELVVKTLVGGAAPVGPWNAARVAVESREFQRAIALLEPHEVELDEAALVQLSLALESVGRQDDALRVLERRRGRMGTHAMGVLAGRLKRRWLVERVEADANRARELYAEGFARAVSAGNAAQAFYHGINVAFMDLAHAGNPKAAAEMAREVLSHCGNAPPERWRFATEGEALLHLDNTADALDAYQRAATTAPPPREVESMYRQAVWVAKLRTNEDAEAGLVAIFRRGDT